MFLFLYPLKSLSYKFSFHHVIWIIELSLPIGLLARNNVSLNSTEFSFLVMLSKIWVHSLPERRMTNQITHKGQQSFNSFLPVDWLLYDDDKQHYTGNFSRHLYHIRLTQDHISHGSLRRFRAVLASPSRLED